MRGYAACILGEVKEYMFCTEQICLKNWEYSFQDKGVDTETEIEQMANKTESSHREYDGLTVNNDLQNKETGLRN